MVDVVEASVVDGGHRAKARSIVKVHACFHEDPYSSPGARFPQPMNYSVNVPMTYSKHTG